MPLLNYTTRIPAHKTAAEIQEILATQNALIESGQADLDRLRGRLDDYRAGNDVRAYYSLAGSYNREAADLESLIDEYNMQVNRYKALIGDI